MNFGTFGIAGQFNLTFFYKKAFCF
jgi:hypothetical protein